MGGVILGAVLPGGGYGTVGKAAVKAADKAVDAVKVVDKAVDSAKAVDKAVDAAKAADKVADAGKSAKTFGGNQSTKSATSKEAFGKAKEANGIPRSAQPNKTIKPNTPGGKAAGLDSRNTRQHEFTNSKGEKISIRQDKAAKYNSGGKGDQSNHYNAGKSGEKLKQHQVSQFQIYNSVFLYINHTYFYLLILRHQNMVEVCCLFE